VVTGLETILLDFINQVYQFLQWPGVILLMAIESACIPLPSEIIMPLAGWLLVKNAGHGLSFLLLAGLFGAIGNVLGSWVAYWVGMWGGRPLLEKWGKYILISRHDLDRADYWFKKYGTISIFVSRLLPAVRTFISLPAGIARMNFIKFTIYSFLGAFIWSVGLAAAGYFIGEHWETVRNAMRPFDLVIIGLVVLAISYYIYRHVRNLKSQNAKLKTGTGENSPQNPS
jgi:membrane protein DedA with SNARE-associated domain